MQKLHANREHGASVANVSQCMLTLAKFEAR